MFGNMVIAFRNDVGIRFEKTVIYFANEDFQVFVGNIVCVHNIKE